MVYIVLLVLTVCFKFWNLICEFDSLREKLDDLETFVGSNES
jgi:hypothetical protein